MSSATRSLRTLTVICSLLLAAVLPLRGAAEGVDPAVEKQLRARLGFNAIGLGVESVEPSEVPGLYRVQLEQGPVVYATGDGSHFIAGDLYSVRPEGLVNLAEERRSGERRERLDAVAMKDMIVFPAQGQTRAAIEVFTDVSCFYCQKLHQEVPELNRRGIEVRYLAYPRQGIGSAGFRQLATAWCAKNPQDTLTRLKNRENLDDNVCPGNPVASQYELGQQLGVRGTPAIVMPDGEMVPGYRSAADLSAALGLSD
jgi:thiol:disulfide interchange protein DsbC